MGYSFVISSSIRHVKGLELKSVVFVFGIYCCEPTSCVQRSCSCKWKAIVRLQKLKKNHQRDSSNIRSGQIKSLVHSEERRTHWWAQQHKKAWTSTEDKGDGWSQDPLYGKEKPIHNIQTSKGHSPGGGRVIVKVYNQEKTSREQIQSIHHKVQTIYKPEE